MIAAKGAEAVSETCQGLLRSSVREGIVARLGDRGELWGQPRYNEVAGEWEAIVALACGPLVVMGFRVRAVDVVKLSR